MCIGYRIIQYQCQCKYNWLTKKCETHPDEHDGTSFELPNRANVPCQLVKDRQYCPGVDREEAVDTMKLKLFCPHCVESKQEELRKFFCEEYAVTAPHVEKFNDNARALLDFALTDIMRNPVTRVPIADTQHIERKLRTLEKRVLKWNPNMGVPSKSHSLKIQRWARGEAKDLDDGASSSDNDNAGEGSSRPRRPSRS
ncbi:hypothetical protein CMQ_8121 [Grosmannia clavigera kw1407]|uniref:Uncharacterized protein n=1 Tax=Grosmannia clavigera (strain kw1407 / UAMH 11150) TaxID=655863 RepID=F0XL06_GROCL|nr:uncharacterized protein CMQ_8121 [Grosmannia clavigera kw1407]EFX01655.1 hypothetical protein CMQ_8121 [Grosmannia clavigera kw1407]